LTSINNQKTGPVKGGAGFRYWREKSAYLGVLPFLIFTGIFLVYRTWSVVTGAFEDQSGKFDTSKISELLSSYSVRIAFFNSLD